MSTSNTERKETIENLRSLASTICSNLSSSRKPLVIEFAGLPKAGKTTLINSLSLFLRRNGIRTKVITEQATICPISDKLDLTFNVWTGCSSLLRFLELVQDPIYNVIIFDRGIYDSIVWLHLLTDEHKLTVDEFETIRHFAFLERWRKSINLLIEVKTEPKKALEREFKDALTDIPGRIMNRSILEKYLSHAKIVKDKYSGLFKKYINVDTTKDTTEKNVEQITIQVLKMLKYLSDEELVVIKTSDFNTNINLSGFNKDRVYFRALENLIASSTIKPHRSEAENDINLIQIVTVCVITYKNKILVNTKYEVDSESRFNLANQIWIGGHLRYEDESSKPPAQWMLSCVRRELKEELQFHEDLNPKLLGMVYDRTHPKSLQHIGVVFEIKLPESFNYRSLEGQRQRERSGQSIVTRFVSLEQDNRELAELEQWSYFILRDYYNIKVAMKDEKQLLLY